MTRVIGRLPNGKCARHATPHPPHSPSPVPVPPDHPVVPFRPLPAETLREIFLYCMVGSISDLDPSNAPLVLRGVSRAWKTVADSTPCLWSTITVTPPQILLSNVQVIREWLQRAGPTSTLNISVHVLPDFPNLNLLTGILAEFMPSSRRWQHLDLSIPVGFLPLLLSNPGASLPALESLQLTLDHQPHLVIDRSATRLRSISFKLSTLSPLNQLNGGRLDLAWHQITHLNIRTVTSTINAIWDIFLQCPRLLSLIITVSDNSSIRKMPPPRDHLFRSNIRQLTIVVNTHPVVIGHFIGRLYLPRLQELQLRFADPASEPYLWPRMAILDLRERCLPPLTSVAVAGKWICEADLVDFVRKMRHLEQLDVTYGSVNLVTRTVRNLLPRDDDDIMQRRAAYWDEVYDANFFGKVSRRDDDMW